MRSLSLSSQVPTIFLLSGLVIQASQVKKVNHLNQTNQGGSSEPNKVKQVLLLLGVHGITELYNLYSLGLRDCGIPHILVPSIFNYEHQNRGLLI